MTIHRVIVATYDSGVKSTCTCGWIDRWPGPGDGSAQQAAAAHVARYKKEREEKEPHEA